ncbi:nuclear transport factor 2 family protein [Flavobacteriaceae bacterium S0825]|uniref:nuclear transport factor 2 family protein n=1 Tax=Gaetbulibacter sp. S0825 TaxID=2720084 RepID=UPI001430F6F8|nr:nuclear transport factor 2 family protein [Gaetbulibacter sp. S0825]MCK0109685.1 nuclear transport factor 2 family protein [Flavobacteriaceae bacterium S0825]NIX65317.1 nuclear transport factor 2 family protein [Gaetbulibacter sp. S0825]
MKKMFSLLIALTICFLTSAQQTVEELDIESEKAAVKNLVEEFLTAIGNHDIETVQTLFSDKANISGASLRNGKWITNTYTIQEFLERLKAYNNPTKYTEPVSDFIVHMEMGMLAFVRADAIFTINGEPRNNNLDYFTLIKENGNWKILNGSYVSVRIKN